MEKYIENKIYNYKHCLYSVYLIALTLSLSLFFSYSVISEINIINENNSLNTFINNIWFSHLSYPLFIMSSACFILFCFWIISSYANKMSNKINIKHEDVVVLIPNSTKALYDLLNKNIVIDENNLEIDVMNFPDSKIDILSTERDLFSITIRKYTLEGPDKVLRKFKLTSDKTYNYILSINV